MVRIAIIGGSGAGKSALARRLGAALNVEVHHIDKMYWQCGWVVRNKTDFMALATNALEKESWIFDGFPGQCWETHGHTLDTLVFLDVPYFKRFWRVMARSVKNGKNRGPDNAGNLAGIFRKAFIYNWLLGWHLRAHWRCIEVLENVPTNVRRVHLAGELSLESYVADLEQKTEHTGC